MLLTSDALDDGQRRDLQVVTRNARALLKHVNDLLDVSKLDAGKMELHYSHVDLAALVRRVAGLFESLAADRQMSLAVETPAALEAQVDADKLERVVINLL